uniref:Uncharacterized protein n=1 Tax=Varanus komodoensis TaxID=61221 RepID=A0A8D2JKS8_VARKO
IEAIFSAADIGFRGSLVGSNIPAAYMGTITGCFLLPRSFLLLWEPPHWVSSVPQGVISSSISETGTEGKQVSNISSRRLRSPVCSRTDKIKWLKIMLISIFN